MVTCVCIVGQWDEMVRGLQTPFFPCREKLADHVQLFIKAGRLNNYGARLSRHSVACLCVAAGPSPRQQSRNVLKRGKKYLPTGFSFSFLLPKE